MGWEYWTKFELRRSRGLILALVQPEGGLASLRAGASPVAVRDDFPTWLFQNAV
jgi:hypothetical protein